MSKFVKLTVVTGPADNYGSHDFTLNADSILHFATTPIEDPSGNCYCNITLKPEVAKSVIDYAESAIVAFDSPDTLCVKNTYGDINKQLGVE